MTDLFVGLVGGGAGAFLMGCMFNGIAAKTVSDEARARLKLPLMEAIQPPPGTPPRLKPFGEWAFRGPLLLNVCFVVGGKLGPRPWRWGGVVLIAIGSVGLLIT